MSKKNAFFVFQAILIIMGFLIPWMNTPDKGNQSGLSIAFQLISQSGNQLFLGVALLLSFLTALSSITSAVFNTTIARTTSLISGFLIIIPYFLIIVFIKKTSVLLGLNPQSSSYFFEVLRPGVYFTITAVLFGIAGIFSKSEEFDSYPFLGNIEFRNEDTKTLLLLILFLFICIGPVFAAPWSDASGFMPLDQFFMAFFPGQWITTPLFFLLFISSSWAYLSAIVNRLDLKMLEKLHQEKLAAQPK